jgi:hypothetical protein
MDDQDDFDLYDDIIGGDEGAEVPPSNEEVTKWREEVADSKVDVVLFQKISKFFEINFFRNFSKNLIYIIIWLSPYVLSVQSLSPPKPAGLDPQIFAGRL